MGLKPNLHEIHAPAAFTLKTGAWLPISLGKQAPIHTGHRATIASEGIGGWSARLMTVQVTCLRTVLVPELLGLFGNRTPKNDKIMEHGD